VPEESSFEEILNASAERLVNLFYRISVPEDDPRAKRLRKIARRLSLNSTELICALGFNSEIRDLTDVLSVLGFDAYDQLAKKRNELFVADIYDRLGIDDVLAIYAAIMDEPEMLEIMQYLLTTRLENIEKRIEATVNSLIIERYKKEMRAIYADGIAQIEFAESRLNRTDSGFRALVNEVAIITESKLIPVGDIFFRNSILPEEKRKLINKGLITDDLIRARLADPGIPDQERRMLEEHVGSS
jgi:hypothetical protein